MAENIDIKKFSKYLLWLHDMYSYPYIGLLDLSKPMDFSNLKFPLGAKRIWQTTKKTFSG